MKKLSVFLLALFSSMFMAAQNQNAEGLYVDSEGNLFTGTISKTVNDSKTDFTVKEGVVEGAANYYYASGKLMESGMFTKGVKDNKWTRYNENGSVMAVAFYNMGKKTGTWLVYDDKGNKRYEMNYVDGEKTGIWTNWDESGLVASTKDYTKVN